MSSNKTCDLFLLRVGGVFIELRLDDAVSESIAFAVDYLSSCQRILKKRGLTKND